MSEGIIYGNLAPSGRLPAPAVEHVREMVPDLGEMQTLAGQTTAAAGQVATDAQAVADAVDLVEEISGLTGEDDAVALLMADDTSATSAAMAALTVPHTILSPTPTPPAGFRGLVNAPPLSIRRRMGRFEVDWDLDSLRPAAGVTYYVAPDGAHAADGLTPGTPTTVSSAIQKPDVGTIVYASGEYFRNLHAVSVGATYGSISHIASEPGVMLTAFENPAATTWTLHASNIWRVDRNEPHDIFDTSHLTDWGDYTQYTRVASEADITEPGQWAWSGGTLYVRALGDADLSGPQKLRLRLSIATHKAGDARPGTTQWVQGIEFHGGSQAYGSAGSHDPTSRSVLIDCKFKYSRSNGVYVSGGALTALVRCEVSSVGTDGLNYHDTSGHGTEFVEIDCHVHHTGENASSAHEAVTGVRVGGLYDRVATSVVADVNSAQSWNLGCHAGAQFPVSEMRSASYRAGGFAAIPGKGFATLWLDECTSSGSERAFSIVDGGAIRIHAHGASNPEWITDLDSPPTLYRRT